MLAQTNCYEEKFIMQNSFPVPGPDDNDPSDETYSIFGGDPGPDDSDPPEETNFAFSTFSLTGPGPDDDDPPPPPQKRA
jgi:hypothetical protein